MAAETDNNNKKKNIDRRVLGDIGNCVKSRIGIPEAKNLPKISRPVTRSFGAQLLRNTRGVGCDAKAVKPDAAERRVVVKPVVGRQKPVPKPTTQELIVISSDSKLKPRNKVSTLTSVLSARSKEACGMLGRQNEEKEVVAGAIDIDGKDVSSQLHIVEYIDDIYKYYRSTENITRPGEYMATQVEINAKMRAILADWLIEVHERFELRPETLYLAFYIVDKYLSLESVLRRELQLVGMSAMLVACKYEEIWAPEVNDFICISDKAYNREQILVKEKKILDKLEWNLTVPTPYVFLVRFLKACFPDKEMEDMAFFFAELGLLEYGVMTRYSPSKFAASAVYAARCTLNKSPLWTQTLQSHTVFSESEVIECAKLLLNSSYRSSESKLKVVRKKYSSLKLSSVASFKPSNEK